MGTKLISRPRPLTKPPHRRIVGAGVGETYERKTWAIGPTGTQEARGARGNESGIGAQVVQSPGEIPFPDPAAPGERKNLAGHPIQVVRAYSGSRLSLCSGADTIPIPYRLQVCVVRVRGVDQGANLGLSQDQNFAAHENHLPSVAATAVTGSPPRCHGTPVCADRCLSPWCPAR